MTPTPPEPRQAACDLPGTSDRTPSLARAFAAAHLYRWGMQEHTVDMAELITSELTTNAIRHGGDGPVTLGLYLPSPLPLLKISVTDRGRVGGLARPALPGPDAESGRGLAMVEAVAALLSHKHSIAPPTTTVWAMLRLA
ncbi:ATP-binding protein [Streptomyces sp. SID4931]|nr:ATP-binding protein [Streptomyces sp. SID4931]SCG08277.1 Histidine kinase-like ATPase domain-containing protein [Streptomyces sp. Ncost-T6T-2b]